MTLWPFRKRSKTNSGGKIEKGDTWTDDSPRQTTKGKQPEPRRVTIPEFPLPPDNIGSTFQPQKQYHQGGFSSYFVEHSHTLSDSSDSTQLPHKTPHKPGLLRKLSKKISSASESRNAQNAYITPPTSGAENSSPEMKKSKFGRSNSTKRQPKKGAFNWLGQERSTNFPPPARDVTSSLSSNSSVRPLKPRLKGFEKFTPRPKVIFGYETPAATPDPGAQLQHASTRRNRQVTEDELAASSTVDGLADDLDARGLREAMERDRRRREKKKLEEHLRVEQRMERRLMKQKAAEEMEFDADNEIGDSFLAGPSQPRSNRTGAVDAPYAPSPRVQTPVSWLRDPSTEDLSNTVPPTHNFENANPSQQSSNHTIQDFTPSNPPHLEISPDGARRAKLTSFLKKATATRIRKEHANHKIRAGESTLVSDSEDDGHRHHPQAGFSQTWGEGTQTEVQPIPIHHGSSEQVVDHGGENRSGSDSSWQSSHMQGYMGYTSEPPKPIRSVVSRTTEPLMDSPTIPAGIREASQTPHASFSEVVPEGRDMVSRASTQRYDSRAVSPNAPSAISTLASIDSEGSWLSGKVSRQSFSRQSGRLSRQSISRQSTSHPSPLGASSRHNHTNDATEDETEDDEFYGKIENNHGHLSREAFEEEAFEEEDEDENMGRSDQAVLDLSDGEGEDSDGGAVQGAKNPGRIRDGFAKNPEVHTPEYRMSSRIGYLKYYDEEDDEPPSPTAATLGGYESSSPHSRPLQHPFAEEGENFVTPLEHLSETRPRYTGVI